MRYCAGTCEHVLSKTAVPVPSLTAENLVHLRLVQFNNGNSIIPVVFHFKNDNFFSDLLKKNKKYKKLVMCKAF